MKQMICEILAEYPPNMSVKDVSKFLGISESTAYGIIRQSDFPKLNIEGSRKKIIPKHKFSLWYEKKLVLNYTFQCKKVIIALAYCKYSNCCYLGKGANNGKR